MKRAKDDTLNKEDELGQGFVEYALILILVGIAVVLIVSLMQPAIGDVFSRFVAQAPVAPPSLVNYTPPPTASNTPTVDPLATATLTPSNTPTASQTPTPSQTPTASQTPTPSPTPTSPPCDYGPHQASANSTVRVEVEDFRCGTASEPSFSDQTGDGGSGSVVYRTDYGSEGPDLESTSDDGGGYNLGWTEDGEWLEFEVTASTNSAYTFIIRYAAPNSNSQLRINTSYADLTAQTPVLNLPSTGGTQNWGNYITQVTLFSGRNILRFNIANGGFNLNYFDITPYVPTATPRPAMLLPSNAAHDGDVRAQNSNNNSGGPTNNGRSQIYVGDDGNDRQYVGIISFDTSGLPANATITNVELRLQQQSVVGNPFGNLNTLYADIAPANGFDASYDLESDDYLAGAAAGNVISFAAPSGNNTWTSGTLGAGNFNRINRTGYTQFRIHFQTPDDGDRTEDQFRFYSGDAGSANSPQLIITYTTP
ncbi:carbohydrate-binding domain-containing protein [Candidatus Leptofilum sp.]|uniref:carbohydrate-binding domain-containing protein n=1 Tax=Candidatus Leptofilum sp. TaxID=3241576 RepID=UPI003B597F97